MKCKALVQSFGVFVAVLSGNVASGDGGGMIVSNVFLADFEHGAAGWNTAGCWETGVPLTGPLSGYGSSNCAATRLAGNYPDNADDFLTSPQIQLPPVSNSFGSIKLSFREWLRTEKDLDSAQLRISTNGGLAWTVLSSSSGSSDWRRVEYDISACAGAGIRVGFVMTSDESINFAGWYVDDIGIDYVYPAPLAAVVRSVDSRNFPYVEAHVSVTTNGHAVTNLVQANFTVRENGLIQTQKLEVLPPSVAGVDIVFLIDTTGSMSSSIDDVKSNVTDFVESLAAQGIDARLAGVNFRDSLNAGDPPPSGFGFVSTSEEFITGWLDPMTVGGGGDTPEDDLGALTFALNDSNFSPSYRPGSARMFILITDADMKNTEDPGDVSAGAVLSATNVVAALNQAGVIVHVVTVPGNDTEALAAPTGGMLFDIGSGFNEILNKISEYAATLYTIHYQSSDPFAAPTARNIAVEVNYLTMSCTNSSHFTPMSTPRLERTDPTVALHQNSWPAGASFKIEARALDHVAPFVNGVVLYYKAATNASYDSAVMSNTCGDIWSAFIPTNCVAAPGLDYYLTATDGDSISSDPSLDPRGNCYQLAILPNSAPVIVHTPVLSPALGAPLAVQAAITDTTANVASAKVFYRKTGRLLYSMAPMSNTTGSTYEGIIPASAVTSEGLDYYLKAVDNQGVAGCHGTPDKPHQTLVPDIDVFPLSLGAGMRTGGTATRYVTVSNTAAGQGPLVFELAGSNNVVRGMVGFNPLGGYLDLPGKATNIAITFNAAGLTGGVYSANLIVISNDPDEPQINVAALLTVTSACDIAVAATALDFGTVFAGCIATQALRISNAGFVALNVSSATADSPRFGVSPAAVIVPAGTSAVLLCTYSPVSTGTSTGVLSLASDDPDMPVVKVALSGRAVAAPVMLVSPVSVSTSMQAGATGFVTVTIDNSAGGSPLDFSSWISSSNASPHGADASGYSWVDSNDPGGPQFANGWLDISGVGATGALTGGASYQYASLPFGFSFYGKSRSGMYVSSCGALSFDNIPGWSNRRFPSTDAPNDLIAPFWGDLVSNGGTNYVYYDQAGRRYIVQYNGWGYYYGGGGYTFQAQLYENGDIYYYYQAMTGVLDIASIGCENSTGETGLDISYCSVRATNGLAVRISPSGSFLQLDCSSARVPAGTSRQLRISVDASMLVAGTYCRDVVIAGNAPDAPSVTVPLQFSVSGIPDITVDAALSVTNLGVVFIGQTCTGLVRVASTGTDVLNISSANSDNPAWTPGLTTFQLAVGQVRFVPYAFTATAVGISTANVSLVSNDPDEPAVQVRLTADCRQPPVVSVNTSPIATNLYLGSACARTLTISNSGLGALTFSLAVRQAVSGSYSWTSSDQAGGPTFEWIDITAAGTLSTLSGDDNYVDLTLPFAFPFYGENKTSVRASCNGYLTFGADGSDTSWTDMPDTEEPNDLIAVYWDDLHQRSAGVHRYYHDVARQRYIMQYTDWDNYSSSSLYTFQVQLCKSGDIYFFYKTMTGSVDDAAIGIENKDGTAGLRVAAGGAFVHSNLAVRIIAPRGFLSASAAGGTVAAGGATNITLFFDAADLVEPDYDAE
ncbi:MAG: hypothetical protein C0404_15030, partial [Verrucomicrobia bacterium]|nr:hypothetical protein [Verrucomicrobiota bacterium]